MALLPPSPIGQPPGNSFWNDWYEKLRTIINTGAITISWTNVTGTPTTLAGYGITNGQTILLNSAGLAAALSDETGTGQAVFNNIPTLIAPILGTPTSGNLSNCTGYPAGSISGIVGPANGGTGKANNAASTLTISGAFASTFTITGVTSVTFPTSGTLATTSQLPTGANPTTSVGLSIVNGSATTFMRSDGAPALSQSIVPTWTGTHTFNNTIVGSISGSSGSTTGNAATATALQTARNINGTSFNGTADITITAAAGTLTGATLAAGVTASSLTSVGTLTSLTMSGAITGVTDFTNTGNSILGNASADTLNAGNGDLIKDSSGRVGVGVTPSAWTSGNKVIDLNTRGLGLGGGTDSGSVTVNAYNDTGTWKYKGTSALGPTKIEFFDGATTISRAVSGTAAATITWLDTVIFTSAGKVALQTVGAGLSIKEGSNAKQGTATLVAGASVVSNTSVTASSRIFLTSQADGGTPGFLRVSARTAGTSFTITSSNAADTSTVAYEIFEPS